MEQEGQFLACFPTGKKEMNQKEVLEHLLPIGERKPMFKRYLEKYLLNGWVLILPTCPVPTWPKRWPKPRNETVETMDTVGFLTFWFFQKPDTKGHESTGQQGFDGSSNLHTQEVTGSSPVVSAKNTSKPYGFEVFLLFFETFFRRIFLPFFSGHRIAYKRVNSTFGCAGFLIFVVSPID